jgi:DNA-directed RNA polymerase specialized sigma24 family protein
VGGQGSGSLVRCAVPRPVAAAVRVLNAEERAMPRKDGFLEDECLVRRCLADEQRAWEQLEGYRPGLEYDARKFQRRRPVPACAPEDIVQDVWLRLCDREHSLLSAYNCHLAPLKIYLRSLVCRRIRALRGQARRRIGEVTLAPGHDHADPGASGGITDAEFHECLDRLGPAEQQLLAEGLRERQPGEERPPLSPRRRKAKQRLTAKIKAAVDRD